MTEQATPCRPLTTVVNGVLCRMRKNIVLCIAACAAIVTSCMVKPDAQYATYFDFKTLTCLFCVLAVVCALRNIRFFYTLAKAIIRKFKNAKLTLLMLVYITFIGSMLIANDMALLTFLPLGYFVLHTTGKEKYMAFTFIMQNIAANLGGMLTPFGNPQNLYLYSKFNIPDLEFLVEIELCAQFVFCTKTPPFRRTLKNLHLQMLRAVLEHSGKRDRTVVNSLDAGPKRFAVVICDRAHRRNKPHRNTKQRKCQCWDVVSFSHKITRKEAFSGDSRYPYCPACPPQCQPWRHAPW